MNQKQSGRGHTLLSIQGPCINFIKFLLNVAVAVRWLQQCDFTKTGWSFISKTFHSLPYKTKQTFMVSATVTLISSENLECKKTAKKIREKVFTGSRW